MKDEQGTENPGSLNRPAALPQPPSLAQRGTGAGPSSFILHPSSFTTWLVRSRGVISLAVLIPVGAMAAFSPLHYPLDSWGQFGCQCAGWLLFLAGAAMRWWATLYLGGRKSKELITEGPYSVSRNPIYIGTFALTLSIGVLSQSVTFSLAVLVVSAVYVILTVSLEESELGAEHGEQFRAYRERVPRFIPKPYLYHSPGTISVRASGLWAEFIRACRWASIPIACDLIAHLRAEPWWPAWFALP